MAFQLGRHTELREQSGRLMVPAVILNADARVERQDPIVLSTMRRDEGGDIPLNTKLAHVTSLADAHIAGWVIERQLQPIYGRDTKQDSYLLIGNQETRDRCQQFSKALDALNHTARPGFMLGVLQCEDLDGKTIFYAAIAGNHRLPQGWEEVAKKITCIPAPNVREGRDHLRQISGRVFKPVQAGARVKADLPVFAGKKQNDIDINIGAADWDEDFAKPVSRHGNIPGACAAQKMLQAAIKNVATPRYMSEQWYDANKGLKHGTAIESCPTCQVTVTRMLKR